jgi:chemotaxis protein methyltransferase CheR
MTAFDASVIERFREVVARRLGLLFDASRLDFLGEVLWRRLDASNESAEDFLARLEVDDVASERMQYLARELTVAETYFFRNPDQFRAFMRDVLPERVLANAARRRLRLLSAGCATGEEAYSLAISIREQLGDDWTVSLEAVDINRAVLERARRGLYTAWALRETPDDVRKRWFRPLGREFALDDRVRGMVSFAERNLVAQDPGLWAHDSYDVVFLRNVIMYFTPGQTEAIVARVARALVPGGYLFLGHAETLRGMSHDFQLQHTQGTFYYRRRTTKPELASAEISPPAVRAETPLAPVVESADGWVDAIRKASDRIRMLAGSADRVEVARSNASAPPTARDNVRNAIELFGDERYEEARALVDGLSPDDAREPGVLLLRAALLTHSGALADAESACLDLLSADELNAGAHYLLALCREGVGDTLGAMEHDHIAAYADPGFAMPRLHLGLLARRAGDRENARRELGHALILLQREEPSRLLLFGGGFGRDALVALCRTEFITCGGIP